jgi:hypothetical protein
MARTVRHTIDIDATPAEVWQTLVAFDERGDWDPYYREVEGPAEEGARLLVRARLDEGARLVTARPRVLVVEPAVRLVWGGRLLLPAILTNRQEFHLEQVARGVTRLTQTERFTGILTVLAPGLLDKVDARLAQWVDAVKARVESRRVV